MLEKITLLYAKFPDSLVERISFNPISENTDSTIEVILSCYNLKKDRKNEIIKLIFKKIKVFNEINLMMIRVCFWMKFILTIKMT